jgi:hypothetical protein
MNCKEAFEKYIKDVFETEVVWHGYCESEPDEFADLKDKGLTTDRAMGRLQARLECEGRAMRIIILCAGDSSKWNSYLGIKNKHFIEINGEPILSRTVRLIKKYAPEAQVIITTKAENLSLYDYDGCDTFIPIRDAFLDRDIDKYNNLIPIWSQNDRTILMLGDVYFTESAMKKILFHKRHSITFFARPHPSKITGHRWREHFATSFWPEHHQTLKDIYKRCIDEHELFCKPGAWEIYGMVIGGKIKSSSKIKSLYKITHFLHLEVLLASVKGHLVLIDDATDDFDTPEDFINWTERCGKIKLKEMIHR